MPEIAEITVNGQPKKINFEINGEIYTLAGGREPVIEPLTVTRNGDYNPPTGTDGYAPVTVDIPSDRKPEQTKTVTITQNGDVTITPDIGKVLSSATVKVSVSSGLQSNFSNIKVTEYTVATTIDGLFYLSSVGFPPENLLGVIAIREGDDPTSASISFIGAVSQYGGDRQPSVFIKNDGYNSPTYGGKQVGFTNGKKNIEFLGKMYAGKTYLFLGFYGPVV